MCVKAREDEAFNAGTLLVSIQILYIHIVHGVRVNCSTAKREKKKYCHM